MADQTGAVDLEELKQRPAFDGWRVLLTVLERDELVAALERITELTEERDRARQASDRLAETIAKALAELPPIPPGTALGRPLHQQVRDLRKRAERLEAAAREVEGQMLTALVQWATGFTGDEVRGWADALAASLATTSEGSELPPLQHTLEELGGSLKPGQLAPASGEEGE